MNPVRCIVVGVSEPVPSDLALLTAVNMARRTGATLHAVHAVRVPLPSLLSPARAYEPQHRQRVVEEVRHAFADRIAAAFPEPIQCEVSTGPPEHAIRELSDRLNADLVVVGATHHGRISRAVLGTTAQRVIRGIRRPVFVVHSSSIDARRVLLATDLTRASASAYERGLDLLEQLGILLGSDLRALLVILTPLSPPPLPADAVERRARQALADFLEDRCRRLKTVSPVIRHGFPSAEIAAEADQWGADLVLLGAHSREASHGLVMGSVAEAAIRDVRCNLLVMPPDGTVIRAGSPSGDQAEKGAWTD